MAALILGALLAGGLAACSSTSTTGNCPTSGTDGGADAGTTPCKPVGQAAAGGW